jgi:hypothetical protein
MLACFAVCADFVPPSPTPLPRPYAIRLIHTLFNFPYGLYQQAKRQSESRRWCCDLSRYVQVSLSAATGISAQLIYPERFQRQH